MSRHDRNWNSLMEALSHQLQQVCAEELAFYAECDRLHNSSSTSEGSSGDESQSDSDDEGWVYVNWEYYQYAP